MDQLGAGVALELVFAARLNPQEAAEKWTRNTGNATQDYVDGVERTSVHPGREAAKNRAGYEAGVRDSVDKWERNVQNYSQEDWKESVRTSGATRFAEGVQNKGQPKMERFMGEFLPFLDNVTQRVRGLPNATAQDRERRMIEQSRGVREFSRRRAR